MPDYRDVLYVCMYARMYVYTYLPSFKINFHLQHSPSVKRGSPLPSAANPSPPIATPTIADYPSVGV